MNSPGSNLQGGVGEIRVKVRLSVTPKTQFPKDNFERHLKPSNSAPPTLGLRRASRAGFDRPVYERPLTLGPAARSLIERLMGVGS